LFALICRDLRDKLHLDRTDGKHRCCQSTGVMLGTGDTSLT
jgi:hypothetical protein